MAITRLGTYAQIKGSSLKLPCRVATTGAITLSGTQTIDGIAVVAGDRVLVKNQGTGSTNGIYIVAAGAWSRAVDMSLNDDVFQGLSVYINLGTTNSNTTFVLTTANPITLGTTSLTFSLSITSPITGSGTTNTLPKFTGASTIGNSNITDSGTLITLDSNTYVNGSLGIGTSSLLGSNLIISKNITGGVNAVNVLSQGAIQSDVTTQAYYFRSNASTQATTFNLSSLGHYLANQGTLGAGSTVTTQAGFWANQTLIGATFNYGFYGQIPAQSNAFNLYMSGGANNYLAGSLGIGTTNLTGTSLNIGKTITGSADSAGVFQQGLVQSDSTNTANGFYNVLNTQAASFTIGTYFHYRTTQGTIGAGSSITTQVGYVVSSSMVGATNNYGFQGSIASGTNRWNLFMNGTAANYLAGDTVIGTQTLGTATQLTLGGTKTAVSAISRGQLINTTLVASANNDFLIGLDINPTFNNGAFTGVQNFGLRVSSITSLQNIAFGLLDNYFITFKNFSSSRTITINPQQNSISSTDGLALGFTSNLSIAVSSVTVARMFSSGNFTIQNGGTFTDAGFRLDVNGTTRFVGTTASDTAPLGSELAAVTGTGTNWTLAGTNLNVGGYTHTVGSADPLTTALAAVNGTYYQIAYTITNRTTGSITINYGGTSTSGITATGASGPLASSTAVLTITPTTDFNGTVVLSIKTIGTSSASSTFASSALVIGTEIRASDISTNLFFGRNNGRRNTTGQQETFIGSQSGINNTTGTLNTFLGSTVGQNNTTGNFNTFIGAGSGQTNVSGGDNTFVGTNSGFSNTGSLNTFLGTNTGRDNTTGFNNTFLGRAAGQANTTGSGNVMIGQAAGRFITGGSVGNTISTGSIFIGDSTRAAADNQTNQIVIGSVTTGLGSNTTIIGTTSTTLTALYGELVLGSTTPVSSALLTMTSTTQGFLPPRMTTAQKNAIVSPATGLVVFDTTLGKLCVFATTWQTITST